MSEGAPGVAEDAVVAVNPSWVVREEHDGDALLFDADTGEVWVANRTTVAVLGLVDGSRTVAEIVEALRTRFDGFDQQARHDVVHLIASLDDLGVTTSVA